MDIATPLPLHADHLAALEQAYAAPPRAYHHFGHVRAVLQHYAEVAAGPGWRQPTEVWLAVLFHDAVYQPGRSDNEAQSALMAAEAIPRWWPQARVDVERVQALILLTARHGQVQPQDVDEDAALFLDCDMAILAAPAAVFDAYDQAIAEEYRGHVPSVLFRRNRRRFLAAVLKQPRIFLSDYFHT
ncbi:HD domain-containing protein, partial [Xanthomonas euvesicatoria]